MSIIIKPQKQNIMATKKSAAPKAAKQQEYKLDAKTKAKMQKALGVSDEDDDSEDDGEEGGGKIVSILKLYTKGFAKKDIVAYGFNRSTVYRQCKELDNARKGPLTAYYGFEAYEGRVQRLMKLKKWSRQQAIDHILAKDIEE